MASNGLFILIMGVTAVRGDFEVYPMRDQARLCMLSMFLWAVVGMVVVDVEIVDDGDDDEVSEI